MHFVCTYCVLAGVEQYHHTIRLQLAQHMKTITSKLKSVIMGNILAENYLQKSKMTELGI